MEPVDELKEVNKEVAECTRCELHFSRKNSVPGEGPLNANIVLIGEGPGFHENEQGRPFVGAAGKFLEELLAIIGMKRNQVFITNVVKCRPPGNRDPRPEEVETCTSAYLTRQLQAINPKVIVTLGRYSMGWFLPNLKISDVHGQALHVKGKLVVPMYHPAAALHQASLKPTIERDFSRLPELISQAGSEPQKIESVFNEKKEIPKQLNLF